MMLRDRTKFGGRECALGVNEMNERVLQSILGCY